MDTDKNSTTKDVVPASGDIPALGVEQGVETNLAFTNPFYVTDPILSNFNRDLHEVMREEGEHIGPTVRQLVTMRRTDGHARALHRLLALPIRAALKTATFVADEDGEEEAEFMTLQMTTAPAAGGMSITFQRFMSQLLNALFEGFSAFEKVFWVPTHGPLKGKVTLKKLAYRPSDTVTFITHSDGSYAGFRQVARNGGKVTDVFIPKDYSFYYAAQEEERKFYGVSFFESAFYHFDKKVKLYFTAHLAAQRAAVGTRVGLVPPNASKEAKTEFAKNMSNLAFAQWMMMPDGFKVEILRESGSFEFLNLINHHNHMMSESILAQFFDTDTGGGGGESGSLVNFAQPGDDMFVLMLRAVMDEIADQINHYIVPQLIDFNFKGNKYPKFTWGKLTDEQRAAISSTFDKLASFQTVTPEFIRELEKHIADEFGLEIDYDAVDLREEQERAAMEAQAAAEASPAPEDDPDATIAQFESEVAQLALTATTQSEAELIKLAGDLLDAYTG